MRFVDLFSGIGGFHLAASQLDGKCVFACETNKHAAQTYQENWSIAPSGDIRDVASIPECDFVFAGFPCQLHSTARDSNLQIDESEKRIVFEVARLAEGKAKFVLLENVQGLLADRNADILNEIIAEFARRDFQLAYKTISASPWVAQKRKRVFFLGIAGEWSHARADNILSTIKIPPRPHPTFADVYHPPSNEDRSLWLTDKQCYTLFERNCLADGRSNDASGVIDHSKLATTLTASYGHRRFNARSKPFVKFGSQRRMLSLLECKRLMGFPDDFIISPAHVRQEYRQLGNAVVPPVVKAILESVLR